MKILGIISEYNPFHNGHKLHASLARERSGCDFAIALMSGNFVQRGEPAVVDKYLRTKMALSCGFDMVFELPVYYASASAEYFAYNAIRILNACGIITEVAFGSETGRLEGLRETALSLLDETEGFRTSLRAALDSGDSFPKARGKAISAAPSQPNDILAVEYLKALYKTQSVIKPIVITRVGAGYHQTEITGEIASATAVRRALLQQDRGRFSVSVNEPHHFTNPLTGTEVCPLPRLSSAVPEAAWSILNDAFVNGNYVRGLDAYEREFRYSLFTHPQLEAILDISEGLQNRFLEMSGKFAKPSEIISAVKTKRYTHTRLNRAALHILLDIRRVDFEVCASMNVPYIRVLGMKETAGPLMNALKANTSCPVVTNLAPARKMLCRDAWAMLGKEIAATDIYYLGLENRKTVAPGAEWREGFVVCP